MCYSSDVTKKKDENSREDANSEALETQESNFDKTTSMGILGDS